MPDPEVSRWQLTIGQVMVAIAICAVSLASPLLFVFGVGLVFWWWLIVGAIYTRAGRRVAEWCLVAAIILLLYALCQPSVSSRCGGRATRFGSSLLPTQPTIAPTILPSSSGESAP